MPTRRPRRRVIGVAVQPHLPALLLPAPISGLWFPHRMMTGPFSPMPYRFGFPVMAVLVVPGSTGRDPFEVAVQRAVLTAAGATAALMLLAPLEDISVARPARPARRRSPAPVADGRSWAGCGAPAHRIASDVPPVEPAVPAPAGGAPVDVSRPVRGRCHAG